MSRRHLVVLITALYKKRSIFILQAENMGATHY